MKRLAGAVVALTLVVGCGGNASEEAERPGEPSVYSRIESETDCAALQEEFDQAMENAEAREPDDSLREVSLSYAKVADERMNEVGCYGNE